MDEVESLRANVSKLAKDCNRLRRRIATLEAALEKRRRSSLHDDVFITLLTVHVPPDKVEHAKRIMKKVRIT